MTTPPSSPMQTEFESKQPLVTAERLALLSHQTSDKLHIVWDDMGLSEDERTRQLASLVHAVESVFTQKVADELALKEEYVSASKSINLEIDDLSGRLKVDRKFFPHGDAGNLMLKLTWLRDHLQELEELKNERISKLLEIQEQMTSIWNELGERPNPELLILENFLSLDEIEYYESKLVQLVKDKSRRVDAVQTVIRDILQLFEELEFEPETDVDKSIFAGGASLGINLNTVSLLSDRARTLTKEKLARTELLKHLGSQIQPLWEKLHVEEDERERFFVVNTGLGLEMIGGCQRELERLIALKDERMGDLVLEVIERVKDLCDEMCYGDTDRQVLKSFQCQEVEPSDKLLEDLEKEVKLLTKQAELFRPVLKLIEKYEALCIERDEYHEKIQDSTRLLSRKGGSQMRDEEQQRKRITNMPKVVDRIFAAIKEYESLHGEFLLSGVRFVDVLTENEAVHTERMEDERKKKSQRKHGKEDAMKPNKTPGKKPQGHQTPSRNPLANKND